MYTQRIDTGYLKKYKNLTSFEYVNGFSKIPTSSKQLVINQYNVTELKNNNFSVEAYRKSGDLNDLKVIVYVDNVLKFKLTCPVIKPLMTQSKIFIFSVWSKKA